MNASNPAAYGCECIKDDDSIMSERCWKEMYRGDSRKWLIRDASRQKIDSSVCSTTKATFPHPDLTMEEQFVGKCRGIMLSVALCVILTTRSLGQTAWQVRQE